MIDKSKLKKVKQKINSIASDMAYFGATGALYNTLEASEARKTINKKALVLQAKLQVKMQSAKNAGVNMLGNAYKSIQKNNALMTAISAITSLNITKPDQCPAAIMKIVDFVKQFEANVTQSVEDSAEIATTVADLATIAQSAASAAQSVPAIALADGTKIVPKITVTAPSITMADIQAVVSGEPLPEDEKTIIAQLRAETSDEDMKAAYDALI